MLESAISGNQWQSVAISGNQWQSAAISGNQWQPAYLEDARVGAWSAGGGGAEREVELHRVQLQLLEVPDGNRGNQWQSVAIGGTQWQPVAIGANRCQSVAISGSPHTWKYQMRCGEPYRSSNCLLYTSPSPRDAHES
eukprot:1784675-Prymnesium_polylepis.1